MSEQAETLAQKVARMEGRIISLEAKVKALGSGGTAPRAGGTVASDADLDGQWGNPEIKKDPPRWDGASYVGCTYSQCPAAYLETLASFLEWKAGKNAEDPDPKRQKYADYDRKDAARARGWARRRGEDGAATEPRAGTEAEFDGEEVPF